MYIKKISVQEFRCFPHLELEFNYPGKFESGSPKLSNVTLLLGDNGAGKSALLKAIAWGALAPVMPGSGLQPRYFVRRESPLPATKNCSVTAKVVLHKQDGLAPGEEIAERYLQGVVQLIQTSEQWISAAITGDELKSPIFDEQSPANFIVGYGSTRRSESSSTSDSSYEKSRSPRYQRVASLFEDNVALTSTSVALSRIATQFRLQEVVEIVNGLLPDRVQLNPQISTGQGEFTVGDVVLYSSDLSDGFRAFLAWTLDLLSHMSIVAPQSMALTDIKGTVLVDEIDLHLHPKWQRTVVESVARALPNLQFIISTHSPLVVGSLETANILVSENGEFVQATEHAEGLSSDQILTSGLFGLATPRSTDTVYELSNLAQQAASGDKEAAVRFLTTLNTGIGRPKEV